MLAKLKASPRSFQLDLDKGELEVVDVDHVVLDAGQPRVGGTRFQRTADLALRRLKLSSSNVPVVSGTTT